MQIDGFHFILDYETPTMMVRYLAVLAESRYSGETLTQDTLFLDSIDQLDTTKGTSTPSVENVTDLTTETPEVIASSLLESTVSRQSKALLSFLTRLLSGLNLR